MTVPLPFAIATRNPDKAREIVEVIVTRSDAPLAAYNVDDIAFVIDEPERLARTLDALPPRVGTLNVEEAGATLTDNARIKAHAVAQAFDMLAIGDDTGLMVDALDGAPGVRSARYAGEHASYEENTAKLLRELEGIYPALRTARFETVMVAAAPEGHERAAHGVVEGMIAPVPSGDGGFGYDPVFVPVEGDGRTFAEMSSSEKHAISHRGRALDALVTELEED